MRTLLVIALIFLLIPHYSVSHAEPSGSSLSSISELVYSTYLGGRYNDYGCDVVTDAAGYAYVTGYLYSGDFPTTPGAYGIRHNGGDWDVFATKVNPDGLSLVYSTYLGGSKNDGFWHCAIAIDGSGNAYIAGDTESTDFPCTPGAYDTTYNDGYQDSFITKLNATGTALVYSTYIGGSKEDRTYGIALDRSNNALITGETNSTNFPIRSGAFDASYSGGYKDVFVSKINSDGTSLIFSTYLGGSRNDVARDITVDVSDSAFVTGRTDSNNFPTTRLAYDTTNAGTGDIFVTKFNATGSALEFSTFIGSPEFDEAEGIALDSANNVYVTGNTYSNIFPVTSTAFDTTKNGTSSYDAVVCKLDESGSSLLFSTYLGGSSDDFGRSIAVDGSGYVYVAGETSSDTFPIVSTAVGLTYFGGTRDAFACKLSTDGSMLLYSTFIGGSDNDYGLGIAANDSGSACIAGYTASLDFLVSPGSFSTTFEGGDSDVFVCRIDMSEATTLDLDRFATLTFLCICISAAIPLFQSMRQ